MLVERLSEEPAPGQEFGDGETLTPETCSWPTVEWQVSPSDIRKLRPFPSLGSENSGIFAVQVAASVHVVDRVADTHSAPNENGGQAVWAAASRENSGF